MSGRSGAELDLCSFENGLPGLSASNCRVLAEHAAVCLEKNGHQQKIVLKLRGNFRTKHPLTWPPATEQVRRGSADLQEATELGACGVAIAIILRKTKYTVVGRACKGTGFDYWLGHTDSDPMNPFAHNGRLEVSGILDGGTGDVAKRCREKIKQMGRSNRTLPGYAVVVEFGTPMAKVAKR